MFADQYAGKRVFVTGHTGFWGSWLCEWLGMLGAEVTGYSIAVNEAPDHFTALGLQARLHHVIGDVRDAGSLQRAIGEARPDYVFHLAAQALVRRSYREPCETMSTNVVGTLNVLEVLRTLGQKVAAVIVSSDKCYENHGRPHAYGEDDPLGGRDPYSASKGAAEIVAHSYRRSFFGGPGSPVRVSTVRAGNAIGGGDWSEDRIVPDCVRSLLNGDSIAVRHPLSTRPWQHVLEPLSGCLWLGALLGGAGGGRAGAPTADVASGAFNFGPRPEADRTVQELVAELLKHWPGRWHDVSDAAAVPEASLLGLAIDRATNLLQWKPVWSFARAVEATAIWYRSVAQGVPALERTRGDISVYLEDARRAAVRWATG